MHTYVDADIWIKNVEIYQLMGHRNGRTLRCQGCPVDAASRAANSRRARTSQIFSSSDTTRHPGTSRNRSRFFSWALFWSSNPSRHSFVIKKKKKKIYLKKTPWLLRDGKSWTRNIEYRLIASLEEDFEKILISPSSMSLARFSPSVLLFLLLRNLWPDLLRLTTFRRFSW